MLPILVQTPKTTENIIFECEWGNTDIGVKSEKTGESDQWGEDEGDDWGVRGVVGIEKLIGFISKGHFIGRLERKRLSKIVSSRKKFRFLNKRFRILDKAIRNWNKKSDFLKKIKKNTNLNANSWN